MKSPAAITPGLWYIKIDYPPGYTVVSVIKNVLAGDRLEVFSIDAEGSFLPEEYRFIAPVPAPPDD